MANAVPEAVRTAIPAARAASGETARRWRTGDAYRAAEHAFGGGDAAAAAERLLADESWATALLAPLVDALAADPLFEPPMRSSRDAVRTGAILFDCPAASITASVIDAAALAAAPPPATAIFSGRTTVTRYVKAGGATLHRWSADPLTPCFSGATAAPCRPLPPVALADGDVRRTEGRVETALPCSAVSDMVTLTATIRAGADPLVREYRIADGSFVRAASADEGASRTEMLLSFLRLSGRADAGERFAEASHDPAFHLRWAAMREWLALDARAALPRLAEMAHDPNAEIRAAAARTLPLVRSRIAPCPA